jgi:uncharacterized protein
MFKWFLRKVIYAVIVASVCPAMAGAYDDFFTAVERDDPAAASALLRRGFDPNTRNPQVQPALTRAIQAGSLQVVQVLLQHPQTDIDIVNQAGETPLMMAALKGHLDLVRQLLDRGAKPHRSGWSPMHYAATGPEPRTISLLAERGAPLEPISPTQRTPLMMAALYGPEESVRLLVSRGADPKRRNEMGQAAADFARMSGRDALGKWLDAASR